MKLGEVKSNRDPLGFFFVSDNQFNNIFGDPQLLRTKMADKVVVVAIRPPRLDLFAPDMLEHTLKNQGKGNFIIHLGDMVHPLPQMDSYKNAVIEAKNIFKDLIHKINFVPGNHDIGDKPSKFVPAKPFSNESNIKYEREYGYFKKHRFQKFEGTLTFEDK